MIELIQTIAMLCSVHHHSSASYAMAFKQETKCQAHYVSCIEKKRQYYKQNDIKGDFKTMLSIGLRECIVDMNNNLVEPKKESKKDAKFSI